MMFNKKRVSNHFLSSQQPAAGAGDGAPKEEPSPRQATNHPADEKPEIITMDERLRTRLTYLATNYQVEKRLPMETSLFYQTYILDHQDDGGDDDEYSCCNVKKSSYHTVTNWLQAMEKEQLVLLQKQRQCTRNYRTKASFKVVVAIGKKAVQYHLDRQLHQSQRVAAEESSKLSDVVDDDEGNASTGTPVWASPAAAAAASATATAQVVGSEMKEGNPLVEETLKEEAQKSKGVDMDVMLRGCLESIPQEKLPMDMGTFYQRYMISQGCNVHQSSFKTLSEWITEMEKEGLVLAKSKRTGRKNAPTKIVVAAGKDAVDRILGRASTATAEQKSNCCDSSIGNHLDNNNIRLTNADLLDDIRENSSYGIQIQTARHAKDRQKQRSITNRDVEAVLEMKGSKVCRSRDGKRVYTDSSSGITAVVKCGRKNKVVTTWKEDVLDQQQEGNINKRWSQLQSTSREENIDDVGKMDSKSSGGKQQQQLVTFSETYARYHVRHGETSKSKWKKKEGDLIRKKKRYRMNIMIAGLKDDLALNLKNQINNRVGCPCTVGDLNYSEWDALHPGFDPMADEGSKTLSMTIAAEKRIISNILKIVEGAVPRDCRRYLQENLEEAQRGGYLVEQIMRSVGEPEDEEQIVETTRNELIKLYRKQNPEKLESIDALLHKYSGREEQLLKAAQSKYAKEATMEDVFYMNTHSDTCPKHTKVNVEDLLGAFDEEVTGVIEDINNTVESSFPGEEDISSYF